MEALLVKVEKTNYKLIGKINTLKYGSSLHQPVPVLDVKIEPVSGANANDISNLLENAKKNDELFAVVILVATLGSDFKDYIKSKKSLENKVSQIIPSSSSGRYGQTSKKLFKADDLLFSDAEKEFMSDPNTFILSTELLNGEFVNIFGAKTYFRINSFSLAKDDNGRTSMIVSRFFESTAYDTLFTKKINFKVYTPKKCRSTINLNEIVKDISSGEVTLEGGVEDVKYFNNIDGDNVQYYPPCFSRYILPSSPSVYLSIKELFDTYGYALVFNPDTHKYEGVDLVLNATRYKKVQESKGIVNYEGTPDEVFYDFCEREIGDGLKSNVISTQRNSAAFGISNAMSFSRRKPFFSGDEAEPNGGEEEVESKPIDYAHNILQQYFSRCEASDKNKDNNIGIFDRRVYSTSEQSFTNLIYSNDAKIHYISPAVIGLPGATYMLYSDDYYKNPVTTPMLAEDASLVTFPNSDRMLRWELKKRFFRNSNIITWKIGEKYIANAIVRKLYAIRLQKTLGRRTWFMVFGTGKKDTAKALKGSALNTLENDLRLAGYGASNTLRLKKSMIVKKNAAKAASEDSGKYNPIYKSKLLKFRQLSGNSFKYAEKSANDAFLIKFDDIAQFNNNLDSSIVSDYYIEISCTDKNRPTTMTSGKIVCKFVDNISHFDSFRPKNMDMYEDDNEKEGDSAEKFTMDEKELFVAAYEGPVNQSEIDKKAMDDAALERDKFRKDNVDPKEKEMKARWQDVQDTNQIERDKVNKDEKKKKELEKEETRIKDKYDKQIKATKKAAYIPGEKVTKAQKLANLEKQKDAELAALHKNDAIEAETEKYKKSVEDYNRAEQSAKDYDRKAEEKKAYYNNKADIANGILNRNKDK